MKVSVDVSWVGSEIQKPKQVIVISGTNFGPGKVRVSMVRWKKTSFAARFRRRKNLYGFQIHDYKNPLSGQLPTTLDVGERVDLVFPFERDCLFIERPTHVGLRDYFGRDHFASFKAVRKAQQEFDSAFSGETPNPYEAPGCQG